MILTGEIPISADPARVWDCLLNVECLAACMPGMEQMVQIDDRTFEGVVSASVGPISGKFSYRAQIVETTPPTAMVAELHGTDSVTKSAIHAGTRLTLTAPAGGGTVLGYQADIQVKGRLAILGDMVLRTTAVLMLDEFARRLRQKVETPGTPVRTAV